MERKPRAINLGVNFLYYCTLFYIIINIETCMVFFGFFSVLKFEFSRTFPCWRAGLLGFNSQKLYLTFGICSFFFFGMQQEIVPKRILQMEGAIKNRDFASFAQLTCADSNQFHAVCLDTSPPIFYMNDTSHR